MKPIRLLLVDDHVLFRESLSRLLASESDLEMVGTCGGASEALDILARFVVDVILLDFDLGEDHGNAFIAAARARGCAAKILMVTAGMDFSESTWALNHGASGIFHKHDPPATLVQAIRLVASGGTWVDIKLVQSLAERVPTRETPVSRSGFTEREHSVLRGLFEGASNKEIAGQLSISESAVKASLQQLFQKTGVRTRSQLVRIALERSMGER